MVPKSIFPNVDYSERLVCEAVTQSSLSSNDKVQKRSAALWVMDYFNLSWAMNYFQPFPKWDVAELLWICYCFHRKDAHLRSTGSDLISQVPPYYAHRVNLLSLRIPLVRRKFQPVSSWKPLLCGIIFKADTPYLFGKVEQHNLPTALVSQYTDLSLVNFKTSIL